MQIRFSIREMIRHDFGVDLPLGLGSGVAIDDPLELMPAADWSGRPVEDLQREYLKYLFKGRDMQWQWEESQTVAYPGLNIDVVRVRIQDEDRFEHYYFDTSRYTLGDQERRLSFSDFPELLKSMGEFDAQQREGMSQDERAQKKPWLAVFGDGSTTELAELQKENMVIWEQLLSRELDESMALEAMQQLIRRYYDA